MKIYMTAFLDFVSKSGTPKITSVRAAKAKEGQPYEAGKDYWMPLRSAMIHLHANDGDAQDLDKVIKSVSAKKAGNYELCIKAHKRWMKGKSFTKWKSAPASQWKSGKLTVHVKPELVHTVDGVPRVTKLYFNADRLTPARVGAALFMLQSTCGHLGTPGILEVRRGVLHELPADQIKAQAPLIIGEAGTFATIWDSL
jgi:hypothetical protein